MNHSLTKPFSGGSPEMAMAPIRKYKAVEGIRRIRPPISSMFRVCAQEKEALEHAMVQSVKQPGH